jgi:hypothetical protein
VRFGLQAALSMLKHCFSHFSGNSGKPGKEIVDTRAAFKIFEQRFDRNSRTAKYPGTTNPIRIALDSEERADLKPQIMQYENLPPVSGMYPVSARDVRERSHRHHVLP